MIKAIFITGARDVVNTVFTDGTIRCELWKNNKVVAVRYSSATYEEWLEMRTFDDYIRYGDLIVF